MSCSSPFRTYRRPPKADPHPDVITDEERAYIAERIESGAAPRADLIRKVIRLADERLAKIERLESAADRLITWRD